MLKEITNEAKTYTKRGKPASYIPVLALQSVEQFAACIIDQNGNYFEAGNIDSFMLTRGFYKGSCKNRAFACRE